jgi:hypothetical protein
VTRSQRLAAGAAGLVVLGVAGALLTRLVAGPPSSPGRLPPEALALPEHASLIAGVEFAELRRAGLDRQLAALLPRLPLPELGGEDADPLAGVDRFFYAAPPGAGAIGVGVVLGRFETARVMARLRDAGAEERDGQLMLEQDGRRIAVAATSSGSLVVGEPGPVAETRRALESGQRRLDLARLEPTLAALPEAAAAWGVLGAEALDSLRLLAAGSGLPLPPLPPLSGAGLALTVEATPTLELLVLAVDDEGARGFAETAAGGLALAQMAAKPEWRELLSELSLGREGREVRLRLRLPPERLETLADLLRPALGR